MTYHSGAPRVATVLLFALRAGALSAAPEAEISPAGNDLQIPHQDILELFADQSVAFSDGDRNSGVSAEGAGKAGRAEGLLESSASAGVSGSHDLWPTTPAEEPEEPAGKEFQPIPRQAEPDPPVTATGTAVARRDDESASVLRDSRSLEWSLADFLPLLAVLGLIAVLALVVKRFLPAKRMLTGAGVMEVVARTPLSGKQSLVLVKVGGRLVLLGVTAERINALSTVDDPDQVAMLMGQVASERPGSMSRLFSQNFGEEVRAYSPEPAEQDLEAEAGGQVRGLLDKIRQLQVKRNVA